jgi:predicted chitinase
MTTKDELIDNIKAWMQIEDEIKVLQKEIKERRTKKKVLTAILVDIMKTNDIDCFDMNEGKISYTKSNVKQSVSKKYLMDCLGKYFEENPHVQADDVANYVMENRAVKITEGIRHKGPK